MDKTWDYSVLWGDDNNGPFVQGHDNEDRANEHAAAVEGTVVDNRAENGKHAADAAADSTSDTKTGK